MNTGVNIKTRAYYLSLNVIRLTDKINKSVSSRIIIDQLIRSTTSIEANIVESKYSPTKKDFIHFHYYSLKSANETLYWLCLLRDLNVVSIEEIEPLLKETEEIIKILFTILKKLKADKV